LVRDGKVVSHRSSQLDVRQVSLELWVSNVAYRHPWTYGVSFTLLAILIGLGLGMWLRRDKDD
ncbi:MAG: TIGR02186 family protein, partial [Sulfuricellaceae bacterium]|nr:TIGR02186 family protein [Sulfuricellaceae bacterium]